MWGASRRLLFKSHYLSDGDTALASNNHIVETGGTEKPFLIVDPYTPAKIWFDVFIGGIRRATMNLRPSYRGSVAARLTLVTWHDLTSLRAGTRKLSQWVILILCSLRPRPFAPPPASRNCLQRHFGALCHWVFYRELATAILE